MAIFEKKFERKTTLDDTQSLSCVIETAQKVNGHTEYVLHVQRGVLKENSWYLTRRYNDFLALHKHLRISDIELPLPAKKIVGNMRPEFIAERLLALQNYINIILMNPILASSLPAKKFVDPESYNQSFHDVSVQNASLCLRAEGQFVLGQSLGAIGWRLRKHYFKVNLKSASQRSVSSTAKHVLTKSGSQSHAKLLNTSSSTESQPKNTDNFEFFTLSWTEYGPDKYVDDKEIHHIIKSLTSLHHPFIMPIEYAVSNDSGALFIRKFNTKGSLKDQLCGSSAKNPFLNKYGNPKGRAPCSIKEVAIYGRQILEALRFLHSKGMPFGHVHAGNVVIIDGVARLLDIENFVLGVPSFYRPFFVQHSKIHSSEVIDVYSFGHLIYEMTFGYPLQESVSRQAIECSPESLHDLLQSILSKEACKVGLPSLEQLAAYPFWNQYVPKFYDTYMGGVESSKQILNLTQYAKDQIIIAANKTEQRLRDEQKSVKNQKRLVRVQELMSSEEEKRKIKQQKAKSDQRQSKLRQQNSLQSNNVPTLPTPSILSRSDSSISVHAANNSTPIASSSLSNVQPSEYTGDHSASEPNERTALLDSICSFRKSALKKIV